MDIYSGVGIFSTWGVGIFIEGENDDTNLKLTPHALLGVPSSTAPFLITIKYWLSGCSYVASYCSGVPT